MSKLNLVENTSGPSMEFNDASAVEKDHSWLIIGLSAAAVVAVVGLIIFVGLRTPVKPQRLDLARPGSPAFDNYIQNVALTLTDKLTGERLNNTYARIKCTVKNNGGNVITGLQLRAALIGFSKEVLKEKTITPVPKQEEVLKPGQAMKIDLYIDSTPDVSQIMDMIVEITGLDVQ